MYVYEIKENLSKFLFVIRLYIQLIPIVCGCYVGFYDFTNPSMANTGIPWTFTTISPPATCLTRTTYTLLPQ